MSSRLDSIMDWKARAEQASHRVSVLAMQCGVTERQLRRYFQSKFGVSPHFWMAAVRMETARTLLAQSDLIKVVAAEVGFSQQSHFSREFKRHHKISPSSAKSV